MQNNKIPHPRRSIDGVTRTPVSSRLATGESAAPQVPSPAPVARVRSSEPGQLNHKPKSPSRRKEHSKTRTFQWLSYAGVLMIAAVAGFVMQYGPAGYVVLLVYGAACLVLRVSSTVTFLLSIIAITAVVILLFRRSQAMAGYYATYTFLLWVIGALSLGLEQRRAKKSVRGLRINNEL